jgi:hypothetical protein
MTKFKLVPQFRFGQWDRKIPGFFRPERLVDLWLSPSLGNGC